MIGVGSKMIIVLHAVVHKTESRLHVRACGQRLQRNAKVVALLLSW
jgi:hypothetical protein